MQRVFRPLLSLFLGGTAVCFTVAALGGQPAPQPNTPGTAFVVRGATVIDGTGGAPRRNVDIVVRADRIEAIGPAQQVPAGTREIDARGAWVVPGLVDVHVHLDAPMVFQISDEERARILAHTPKAFLYNGVTTILNVSSPPEWIFDLRAKQREGRLLAPRIFATGRSITPDGGWGSRHGGALTDAASARAMVKSFVDMKADAIKIIIEDGLGRSGTYQEMSDEMLRAAADEASRAKTPIVVHAVNLEEYRRALSIAPRAIIHGLEDPIPAGDPLVADLVKGGVFVAPTLSLWEAFNSFDRHPERFDDRVLQGSVLPFLLASMRKPEYRAVERKRFLEVARMDAYTWADARMKTFMANTMAMHRAGVKLAVGTDAGGPVGYNFQGFNTVREMELLVEAGLSPMEVMVAATRTGAELIGAADRLGTLAPGKLADFLVLDADPLADIRNVRRLRTVVLGGVAHPRSEFDARTAAPGDQLEGLIRRFVEMPRGSGADLSRAAIEARVAAQKALLQEVRAVDPAPLSAEQQIDWALMVGQLEGTIFEQETLRPWEQNPELYLQYGSLAGLMDQPGDAAEKGRRVAARLRALNALLAEARKNLRKPPKRFTDGGIYQAAEWRTFLETDVAAFAARAGAAADEVKRANDEAIAALKEFERFLKVDLLPVSTGEFAIGREHYEFILKKRWYMTDNAAAILARGQKAFADTEAQLTEVARRIKPGASWVEVYESLKDDHPPADRIKAEYQAQMEAAQAYLTAHDIVTLPAGERVVTIDTPPAMRRSSPFGTFSSVGPFDKELLGKLVLTPIEDSLTAEQRKERLRSHHRAWIPIIAVHEAYPGHHVAALKANENPRVLRRLVRESIFSEGWGLYCEELMFEQGFLNGDDVRLTQLRNRLWRAARVVIDVGLHTGTMTFDQGVQLLVDKVRFERYAAELEVGMYARRPTMVLGYLIGMMEIADMRAAYEKKFGKPATPKVFFDKLLRIGSLPPSLVRAELLGEPPPIAAVGATAADEALGAAGLWRYVSLGRPTGDETKLGGLFVFKDGRFVQQSLNLGEPFTSQLAQAHAGTFTIENGKIRLLAEVGLIVNPTAASPVASSPNRPHELAVARQPDRLVLTFGSGTVQKFQRVGPASGRIVPLSRGALALVDGYFILVFEDGARALAGSGKYTQQGTALQLTPERWMSANGNQVRYSRARIDATLDGTALTIPGERPIQVVAGTR